jgi:hypothetical protein
VRSLPPASALALAILSALPSRGAAQPYDPAYGWSTIDTEHFQVHFHEGEEPLAQRVAAEAERARTRLVPILRFTPEERTQVVLSDDVDSANGLATPIPYDTIRLYAVPPRGKVELVYRDWVRTLVTHEYTHILQLQQVRGIPRLLNRVFGKLFLPNGVLPSWIVEGTAVLHEGAGAPTTGRNAGALYDMYARALVLEPPGLPSLAWASNPTLDWPGGGVPYVLGGKLLELLQRTRGDAAIAGFFWDQGGWVWPWAPGWPAEGAFGASLLELWEELRRDLGRRYGGQLEEVRRRPVTAPTPLTRRGALAENPRWSPDGRFVAWLDGSYDERSGLRRTTPVGEDLGLAFPIDATGSFALRSPTEAVVSVGEVWHEFRYYEDLWLVELDGGGRRRLTDGERASDPDLLPGGDAVIYVARTPGGGTELRRRPLAGGPAEVVFSRPGATLFSPRLSPDGRTIALVLHEGSRRDLALWRDGALRRLTDDDAIETDPAWSPDGRTLYFASDRGGIFNLYAWEEEAGIRQVTNVETGALEPAPSPDGRTLAFVTYSRSGYDLATVPIDPATWTAPSPAPASADREIEPPGTPLPVRPYSPWATLYPRWWLPAIGADALGWTWGLVTGGQDVLARHTWDLTGWYGETSRRLGWSAGYTAGWLWPAVDLRTERLEVASPGYPSRTEDRWTIFSGGATFTFTRVASFFALRPAWRVTRYATHAGPPSDGAFPSWRAFGDGTLSAAALSAVWTDARRYRRSVSSEEGWSAFATADFAGRETASDYSTERVRGAVAGYLRVPGTRHVVLAGRLAGGRARGSIGGRPPFSLGGLDLSEYGGAIPSAFSVAGSDSLRGYLTGALDGNAFILGNAELRFPLFRPELGRGTWPLFLRRVHGALFLDAGDAFAAGPAPAWPHHRLGAETVQFGAGGELRLELFLGYYLPVELRIGVARGLGPLLAPWVAGAARGSPDATSSLYLTVGPAF